MELESYFDFINENAIRIKGHRIGIEHVLRDYQEGASPEEILLRYPTLTLEKIHATITYYLANREEVDAYMKRVTQIQEEAWQEQEQNPPEFVVQLRKRLEPYRKALREGKLSSMPRAAE
ncbi:DUF433 domain-containing protein [Candidatus Poribacteria bacterium]|nr:DUF433 domain-containing protein [Candidatus Poribacteria bacterium]